MTKSNPVNNKRVAEAVSNFSGYSEEIMSLISNNAYSDFITPDVVNGILNGQATLALEKYVPLDIRKEAGIFFTSTFLADQVAEQIRPLLESGIKVCDPAIGAGNLLIACSKYLPIGDKLEKTLQLWSNWLTGYDLYPEFTRAAKLRLLISAAKRHENNIDVREINLDHYFRGIEQGDVFSHKPITTSDCLVLNSPFVDLLAAKDCTWAKGNIQAAGWFLDKIIQETTAGKHIVAILPDVLNSGTRYQKWRELIASKASSLAIIPAGRFDTNTDVDVFILHLVTGDIKPHITWPYQYSKHDHTQQSVGDYFEVHVGAVVPHRNKKVGQKYPYVHAKTAIKWKILKQIEESRKFSGTVFTPPIVVIHRTSSPQDKDRCVGTIIDLKQNVAIENHLLVLSPKDKTVKSCKQLLKKLKDKRTTIWFNERIRCRHLTTISVKELPWWTI
jgi:N-6 DNA Methylase